MRRDFHLPEDDVAHLNARGCKWETISDGGVNWLLIYEHRMPLGYNVENAVVGIRIEGGYPPGKLDMAYFFPALARADGKEILALTNQSIDGKVFQRWSRHYDWRVGEDDLATHLVHVDHWLNEELKKR